MIKLSNFELNSLIDIYQDALDTLTKARDEYWHSDEDLVRFDKIFQLCKIELNYSREN